MSFVILGKMTELTWRAKDKMGRERLQRKRYSLAHAPSLAYESETGRPLVIAYRAKPVGPSTAAERRAYRVSHWGLDGAGHVFNAEVASSPLVELGPGVSITYTTQKGGDGDLVDYTHEWGEGARGKWTAPVVMTHRCNAARCPGREHLALAFGSYRVTSRGIVG